MPFVDITTPRLVGVLCGLMLAVVIVEAVFPPAHPIPPPTPPEGSCIGEPIVAQYEYSGWLKPHECKVQCQDDEPRYILYTDGRATQCQAPPGCNDEGEDKGVFCIPSLKSE